MVTLQWLIWVTLTTLLLCASCTAMIIAWYLHLRFERMAMHRAIIFSWLIAGAEYMLQVPANRIGAQKAGLPTANLRAIAELATLIAYLVFQTKVLQTKLLVNHVVGFGVVFVGVLIVLIGPWTSPVASYVLTAKMEPEALSVLAESPKVDLGQSAELAAAAQAEEDAAS